MPQMLLKQRSFSYLLNTTYGRRSENASIGSINTGVLNRSMQHPTLSVE